MTNLSEFLLARYAEDEAAAAEAGGDSWEVADPRKVRWVRNGGNAHGWVAFADLPTATDHIARWDPAHVLAECDAKRDVVREHQGYGGICGTCGVRKPETGERWPCRTLRLLSFPYLDHPDYRPEWRP